MIAIKIDVTKISKDRLYQGKQGKYLSAVLIPTPDGKYGDFMIVEDISKQERAAGKKGVILGNGKNLKPSQHAEPPESNQDYSQGESEQDDRPF